MLIYLHKPATTTPKIRAVIRANRQMAWVLASPVGVNSQIVEHGVNGFLASSDREWREALETLLKNPDLRHRMGETGRRKVEREYSIQVYGPKVAKIFHDLITESQRG